VLRWVGHGERGCGSSRGLGSALARLLPVAARGGGRGGEERGVYKAAGGGVGVGTGAAERVWLRERYSRVGLRGLALRYGTGPTYFIFPSVFHCRLDLCGLDYTVMTDGVCEQAICVHGFD
jgi:hypothetical protein